MKLKVKNNVDTYIADLRNLKGPISSNQFDLFI